MPPPELHCLEPLSSSPRGGLQESARACLGAPRWHRVQHSPGLHHCGFNQKNNLFASESDPDSFSQQCSLASRDQRPTPPHPGPRAQAAPPRPPPHSISSAWRVGREVEGGSGDPALGSEPGELIASWAPPVPPPHRTPSGPWNPPTEGLREPDQQ